MGDMMMFVELRLIIHKKSKRLVELRLCSVEWSLFLKRNVWRVGLLKRCEDWLESLDWMVMMVMMMNNKREVTGCGQQLL